MIIHFNIISEVELNSSGLLRWQQQSLPQDFIVLFALALQRSLSLATRVECALPRPCEYAECALFAWDPLLVDESGSRANAHV